MHVHEPHLAQKEDMIMRLLISAN